MNVTLETQPDQRLKQLLRQRGIKQVQLAHALGINSFYFNLVVNGWQSPSRNLRYRIARTLQVPESSIFEIGGGNGG